MPKKKKTENIEILQNKEATKPEPHPAIEEPIRVTFKPPNDVIQVVESIASGLVKIKIKIGTLAFEQGVFQKDDIVTLSAERLAQIDPSEYEIV